jgi:hypothetical protein
VALQFPEHVACPPFSHVMVHGCAAPVQSSAQVEAPSHKRSQPPPVHVSVQLAFTSQS